MPISRYRFTSIIFAATSIALFVFAMLKSIAIPLTHDEALTYTLFVPKSFFDITGYVETYGMPNNHILNTLLIKASTALLGDSTFAIRLPNLLAMLLYLYAACQIALNMSTRALQYSAFVLLLANTYLFDFFSLARGYGMANSLLLYSLWTFFCWWKEPSSRKLLVLFISAALMVLSNFATLYVFFALEACAVLVIFQKTPPTSFSNSLKKLRIPLLSFLILGALLYEPFRCIIKWKTTYGGTTGYWEDCVISFINASNYGVNHGAFFELTVGVLATLFVAALMLFSLTKIVRRESNIAPYLALLVAIPVIATQAQHLILGSEFPVPRAVQYIYPLFFGALLLTVSEIKTRQRLSSGIGVILGAFLLAHFVQTANLVYAQEWKYDASSRSVLDEIQHQNILNGRQAQTRVGITWIFEPSLNYARQQQGITTIAPFTRKKVDSTYDYYYVTTEDSSILAQKGKKTLRYYPISRTSLMK